jgi:hypothetical protein
MLATAFSRYINNYRGFTREIWILTLIINRAGTMVLPFLSKYLKEDLNLSYAGMDHGRFRDGVHVG